ncbi:hypothetical protein PM082_015062 [Marasmius tenuissimus]|nr:hypothetical protein PM082_015062 [Marasmius tenuissimus]
MRAAWVRHHICSDDYYLSMTKYQYHFGQAQAQQEYLKNQSDRVVTITNMIQGLAIIVKLVQPNQVSLSGSGAVPSSYPAVRTNDNRGKRKTSNNLTSEHWSKQPRAEEELEVPSYEVAMIVGHEVEVCTLNEDSYVAEEQLTRAQDLQDLIEEYWTRDQYERDTSQDSDRGHKALQKLFDSSKLLAKEINKLANLNQVSISIEGSEDFAQEIMESVILAYAAAGNMIVAPVEKLHALHKVEKFALNQALGRAYHFIYTQTMAPIL